MSTRASSMSDARKVPRYFAPKEATIRTKREDGRAADIKQERKRKRGELKRKKKRYIKKERKQKR
jgi:hypothetical protein